MKASTALFLILFSAHATAAVNPCEGGVLPLRTKFLRFLAEGQPRPPQHPDPLLIASYLRPWKERLVKLLGSEATLEESIYTPPKNIRKVLSGPRAEGEIILLLVRDDRTIRFYPVLNYDPENHGIEILRSDLNGIGNKTELYDNAYVGLALAILEGDPRLQQYNRPLSSYISGARPASDPQGKVLGMIRLKTKGLSLL